MDLYLLTQPHPAPEAAAAAGRSVRVLCFDWETLQHYQGLGLPAAAWEDHVPEEKIQLLRRFVLGLADSWYLDGTEDPTVFQGISLGKAERYLVWAYYLHPAYKFLAALQSVLAEGPVVERVFCQASVPGVFRSVLAAAQGRGGCPAVDWLGGGDAASDQFAEAAARMRLAHLGPAKRWGYRLLNALSRPAGILASRRRTSVLACYYDPMDGVFQRLGDPAGPYRLSFAIRPPMRHLARMARGGGRMLDVRGAALRLSARQRRELDAIRGRWAGLKERSGYADRFTWKGVCLWPVIRPALDEFFKDELEFLASLAVFFEEHWRLDPPGLVLLPSDGPPFQQLLTEVARLHGTPSVVLLHGLPGEFDCPFDSTNSDYFMVWGPEQKKLFQQSAVFASKNVVAVGNPHFDQYRPFAAGKGPARPARIRKVVVLSSPLNTAYLLSSDLDPQRHATTVLRVLEECGPFETVLKLHPGEALEPYRRLLKDFRGVSILRHADLPACFADADLVLGTFTTASLVAVIMGVPLMLVNLDRSPYVPPFDGSCGLPPSRTAEELAARLREAVRSPEAFADSLRAPYERILAGFAGPLDGTASERVLAELARLSPPTS